jgi:putative transposase
MARPLRIQFEDAIYHLCSRGNDRRRIFQSENDRLVFLELLEKSARRFDVGILCFVLMENHFHLVAQTRRANLVRWMHWLMVSYTVFFNRRHRRSGHLFQGRYKSFLVEEGEYLLGLSRYLHLNPVRGVNLGKGTPSERRVRLRSFPWSSYRGYAGLAKPFAFIEEEMVLGELGGGHGERLRYRRFTEEGLLREIESPLEAVQWQAVLGSESFVQKARDRVKGLHKAKREITLARKAALNVQPKEVLSRVARKFGLEPERLRRRGERGLVARNVAMWMVWESGALNLREIGELFGGLDYAAVAQRIRRTRLTYKPLAKEKLLTAMLNV